MNYYDELEISKIASDEIVKKAYKTLAKKYHPDTYTGSDKKYAEEKFKQISIAYETLSDPQKRKEYDSKLSQTEITQEKIDSILNENMKLKLDIKNLNNYIKNSSNFSQNYDVPKESYNIVRTKSNSSTKKVSFWGSLISYVSYYLKKLLTMVFSIILVLSILFFLMKFQYTHDYLLYTLNFDVLLKLFNIQL